MTNLENEYAEALQNAISIFKERIGYVPKVLISLIEKEGAVNATKRLVVKPNTAGFNRLKDGNLLEYSLEAIALRPEFGELFTEWEKGCCRRSLEGLGFDFSKIDALSRVPKAHSGTNAQKHIAVDEFLMRYRQLQNRLIKKASVFYDEALDVHNAIDVLFDNDVISRKNRDDINFVRVTRNRVAHAADSDEQEIGEEVVRLLEQLENLFGTNEK